MVGNMEDGARFFVYKTDAPEPGTTLTFPELKTEIALPHESSPGVPPIAAGRSATRHIIPAIGKEVEDALQAIVASL